MSWPKEAFLNLRQILTPKSRPATGGNLLYVKSDNELYLLNTDGTEHLVGGGGTGDGVVESIAAGDQIVVDSTDPAHPIISTTGLVESVLAGKGIAVNATDPDNPVVSTTLGWFNVKDYGAVGNGSTDDTSTIGLAIAALNTAGRGVLYFPAGNYKITGDLTTITAHATILGDGAGDLQAQNAASTITYASATGTALTLAGDGTVVRDMALESSTALTHTSGAGIRVTQGDLNRYINVSVRGFYDCINIEDGALWEMRSCYIVGPKRYGIYIRHIDLVDGGDWVILGGGIYAEDRNAISAIRQESAGGGRIVGTKINTLYGTAYFSYGVDSTITNALTSNLILSDMSIENVTTNCVRVTHTGTGGFKHIVLEGVQTAQYQSGSTSAIDISNVSLVSLDGLIMLADPPRSVEAITLTGITTAMVGQRMSSGYSADYVASSSTGITDALGGGVPGTRTVTAGTGLTGGGPLSSDITLAVDTSAEAERARDTIGTALVAGANTTITVNDAGDTITIASTSGTSELLMQDGVTSPPVPIETEAGDDWLYSDV